jgi:hypothetical protein
VTYGRIDVAIRIAATIYTFRYKFDQNNETWNWGSTVSQVHIILMSSSRAMHMVTWPFDISKGMSKYVKTAKETASVSMPMAVIP